MSINELINQLEKIKNKNIKVLAKKGSHITNISEVFECDADGLNFVCIDIEE